MLRRAPHGRPSAVPGAAEAIGAAHNSSAAAIAAGRQRGLLRTGFGASAPGPPESTDTDGAVTG